MSVESELNLAEQQSKQLSFHENLGTKFVDENKVYAFLI
jgi:hypothetical protein